jgi:hypothetical protein
MSRQVSPEAFRQVSRCRSDAGERMKSTERSGIGPISPGAPEGHAVRGMGRGPDACGMLQLPERALWARCAGPRTANVVQSWSCSQGEESNPSPRQRVCALLPAPDGDERDRRAKPRKRATRTRRPGRAKWLGCRTATCGACGSEREASGVRLSLGIEQGFPEVDGCAGNSGRSRYLYGAYGVAIGKPEGRPRGGGQGSGRSDRTGG